MTIVKTHQIKPDGTLAVVIPKAVREKLKIGKGARLVVYAEKDRFVYMPVDKTREMEESS